MWEIAQPKNKKLKLFLFGPPGGFKTRVGLRLGCTNTDSDLTETPTLAVVDTEFGTDHYADEFSFLRQQTNDPDEIYNAINTLVRKPGDVRTLMIDSFSVYYEALVSKFADLFLKREIRSAGHKQEYYTLQPRDYQPINREASKLIRLLMKCDLNVICICQAKDQWGADMKVVGSTFDGFKRLPFYFDTVLEVVENKKGNGFQGIVRYKDRAKIFQRGDIIPWKNDTEVVKIFLDKYGQSLSAGPQAISFDEIEPELIPTPNPVDDVVEQQNKNSSPTGIDSQPGPITSTQKVEIARLKKSLGISDPEVWAKMLEPYNVKSAVDMGAEQANDFIRDLIAKVPT